MEKKLKKIIFLVNTQFSDRDFDRFGFDYLIKQGYCVSAWDCLDIIYNNYETNKDKIKSPVLNKENKNYLLKFANKANLIKHLSKLDKNTIFIINFPLQKNNHFLFKFLNKKEIKYGFMMLGILPFQVSFSELVLKYFSSLYYNLYRVLNKIKFLILKKTPIFNPSFVIVAGEVPRLNILNKFRNNINIIKTHAFDYDRALRKLSLPDNLPKKYAVFLDETNHEHPDLIYNNLIPVCDPKIYMDELNFFFGDFASKFNLPIIISAHPKGDYKNIYKNHSIIHSKTHELVKNAEIVIAQASTSINYAVIYKKPVVFINSINYINSYSTWIKKLAESLGQKPIELTSKALPPKLPDVNQIKYDLYFNNFIKEDIDDERQIWAVFHQYISLT